MSVREFTILDSIEHLGYTHIARDSQGDLCVCTGKMIKSAERWLPSGDDRFALLPEKHSDKKIFKALKWSDENSTEVKPLTKKYNR